RAIAAYGISSVGEACIFALKPGERLGVGINGAAVVDLDCTVVSNSPLKQGGNSCMWTTGIYAVDYIDGDCLYMPDGTDPTVEELGYPKKDPFCRSEELCLGEPENYAGDCTDETTNVTVGPDDTAYLSGNRVYCGDLHIQGTAFFGPGLHHIIGGKFKVNSGAVVHTVSESADVAEAAQNVIDPTDPNYPPENLSYGSTIFLDSVGKNDIFEINGDSSTTLMAPTDASVFYSNNIVGSSELMSGLIGMLFYQTDTADPQAMNKFNGGSELFLDGIVYAPVAECQYNGGSDLDWGYLMLICGTIDFIGTTYINDTPLNGGAADNPYLQDFEYTKLVL
ncbi:MAG: hypothetical protein O7A03_01830, partial [Alphaproteobacteria bacterium]|nr:hypothetical protein [Alphaproteobacteria bacterium]